MTDFVHTLCRDHADWAVDLTIGGSLPIGWRPLVRCVFAGMRSAMAGAQGGRVSLARLDVIGDRLSIEIRNDARRPTPTPVLVALELIVAEAERTSAEVCPFCGRDFGLGAAERGLVARHVGSRPSCEPSPTMRSLLETSADLPSRDRTPPTPRVPRGGC